MLRKLKEAWEIHTDLHLGQLISNISEETDVFYIEDDLLIERIEGYIQENKK